MSPRKAVNRERLTALQERVVLAGRRDFDGTLRRLERLERLAERNGAIDFLDLVVFLRVSVVCACVPELASPP